MGRLSEIYQGVREDASDCWSALCGFHFTHLFDRPRHYNESSNDSQGSGGDVVVPEEWTGLDGQGAKWQPLVTVQPQPEPQPESGRLLQDLQVQNSQRDQLMRERMEREIGEDKWAYRFTWTEPDTRAQIDQGEQLGGGKEERARKVRKAMGPRLQTRTLSPTRDRFYPPESSGSHETGAILQVSWFDLRHLDRATDETPESNQTDVVSAGALESGQIDLVRAVTESSAVVHFSGSKEKFEKTRKHKRKRAASLPLEDTTSLISQPPRWS